MEKLFRLAEIAERLPAPRETLEEGALERKVRTGTLKPGRIAAIVIIVVIVIPLCIGLGILGVLWFLESGGV